MMSGLAAMQRSPADMLRPGKPVSGLAKTYPSRQSMAFVQRATMNLRNATDELFAVLGTDADRDVSRGAG